MEHREGPQTPFEVYCPRCRVTAPVGTRRCVHCGGPVGGGGLRAPAPLRPVPADEELSEEVPVRIGAFSPRILLWLLLATGIALQRVCSGG